MILRALQSAGEVEVDVEEMDEMFSAAEEKGVHMSVAPGYPLAGRYLCLYLCLYLYLYQLNIIGGVLT